MTTVTDYKQRYEEVLRRAQAPVCKMMALDTAIAAKMDSLEKDPNEQELVKRLRKISGKNVEYMALLKSTKETLDSAFSEYAKAAASAANTEGQLCEKLKAAIDAYEASLRNLNASIVEAEKYITQADIDSLPVDEQNNYFCGQFIEKFYKQDLYSFLRPDELAKFFFEKLDKMDYPKNINDVKEESKKDNKKMAMFHRVMAFRKAYDKFVKANDEYKKAVENNNSARKSAQKRYKTLLKHCELFLKYLVYTNAKDRDEKNKLFHQLIKGQKKLRLQVSEQVFLKKMLKHFHLRLKKNEPYQQNDVSVNAVTENYGVIANNMEIDSHVQKVADDAIMIATNDDRMRKLARRHELLMLKMSTIVDLIPRYCTEMKSFSASYTALLEARKLFSDALMTKVNVVDRLNNLKEKIFSYLDKLGMMEEFLAKHPIKKLKAMHQEKEPPVKTKMVLSRLDRNLKTAELVETMQQVLEDEKYNKVENRAEYLIEQLNGLDPDLVKDQAKDGAGFIKRELCSPAESDVLNDFLDEKSTNPQTLQNYVADKLKAFEAAKTRFLQEKDHHEHRSMKFVSSKSKNYKNAEENLKMAEKQLELANYLSFKVIAMTFSRQAELENKFPVLPLTLRDKMSTTKVLANFQLQTDKEMQPAAAPKVDSTSAVRKITTYVRPKQSGLFKLKLVGEARAKRDSRVLAATRLGRKMQQETI